MNKCKCNVYEWSVANYIWGYLQTWFQMWLICEFKSSILMLHFISSILLTTL